MKPRKRKSFKSSYAKQQDQAAWVILLAALVIGSAPFLGYFLAQ